VLDGAATLCHRVAVLEIIIAILHCRTDGVLACIRSCTISSNIWALQCRKLDESAIDIAILRNRYYPYTVRNVGMMSDAQLTMGNHVDSMVRSFVGYVLFDDH